VASDYRVDLFPELANEVPLPELESDMPSVEDGVLPSQEIEKLIRSGRIHATEDAAPVAPRQIQPASLDLRLGRIAYRLQASFLPGSECTVQQKLADLQMAELDLSRPTVLEKECVYLVPLMEALRLPDDLEAKANPKSTTGRLDVFTRLIVDGGTEFEFVRKGYSGPLYAEIVPRTFSVVVHPGLSLSQLRFVRGRAPSSDTHLRDLDREKGLIYLDETNPGTASIRDGLKVSVSLRGDRDSDIVAYRGKKNTPLIDLKRIDHYDIDQFWDAIPSRPDGRLILNPGDFYILASRERVRVPPEYAAEMVPFDPSVGEFRIHYAGFFDPGFGYGDRNITGTRAVLEVRAHETPFVIEHGQVVGRLVYSRVLDVPDKIYGKSIGSSYQRQELALSKQFRRPAPSSSPGE
jgi:dCTP deaminase